MDKTTRLLAEINAKLKDDFKAACYKRGETMKDGLERSMKYYVNKKGNLKEKK